MLYEFSFKYLKYNYTQMIAINLNIKYDWRTVAYIYIVEETVVVLCKLFERIIKMFFSEAKFLSKKKYFFGVLLNFKGKFN